MPKGMQELSTYQKYEEKYLMRWLIGLLNWLTNKITDSEEQVIIVLTKNNPPTFYRTHSSITYVPAGTTVEKVALRTSDWQIFMHMESVKLEDIKQLIEKYVKGIEIRIDIVNNIETLIIDWKQIKMALIEDDKSQTSSKRIPVPYRVLSFLVKNPSCIVKGRNSFNNRLGMKFDTVNKVVYVGDGATYIFNENGFDYVDLHHLKDFKKTNNNDFIDTIEHRENDPTRSRYKRKVNRYFHM